MSRYLGPGDAWMEDFYNDSTLSLNTDSKQSKATEAYTVYGFEHERDALEHMIDTAPVTYDYTIGGTTISLPFQSAEIEAKPGMLLWSGSITYAFTDSGGGGGSDAPDRDTVINFTTMGGTKHITESIETIEEYPVGTAPENNKALHVTRNIDSTVDVNGVDVISPVYSWQQTKWYAPGDIDDIYRGKLFELTGTVNQLAFDVHAAGEVMFLGATGERTGDSSTDYWRLTYSFAAQLNKTGLAFGTITGINKKGWEDLAVAYEPIPDDTKGLIIPTPSAVYVEKIHPDGDFTQFKGIS